MQSPAPIRRMYFPPLIESQSSVHNIWCRHQERHILGGRRGDSEGEVQLSGSWNLD